MKRIWLLLLLTVLAALAQETGRRDPFHIPADPGSGSDPKLPNGKSQNNEIAKEDHQNNIRDAAMLLKLAQDLQAELDHDGAFVVSVKSLKTTDQIEKLAKDIHGRLKRY